jgi:hypothetical protein
MNVSPLKMAENSEHLPNNFYLCSAIPCNQTKIQIIDDVLAKNYRNRGETLSSFLITSLLIPKAASPASIIASVL